MKLSDYRNDYYYFTGQASDVSRNLAFAGIGIIWIFRVSQPELETIPKALLPPMLALIISLGADLLQYVGASAIWGCFHRYHEKRLTGIDNDPPLAASRFLTWPQNVLFWTKIVAVIVSYVLLISYVWDRWFDGA